MAYDPSIEQILLFGGVTNAATWTFDGSDWQEQSTTGAPPQLAGAAMAYYPVSSPPVMILYGGADTEGITRDTTYAYTNNAWYQVTVAASPPPVSQPSMAYDPALGELVLFGGYDSSTGQTVDGTWAFNGSTWTELSPATSPSARYGAQMAYDPATGQIVLFGGASGDSSATLNDTWTFDGSDWSEELPANSPPGTCLGSLVYDATENALVLFGGLEVPANGPVASTWTYDGSTWTQQAPATTPPARFNASMDYDPAVNADVLFGGRVSESSLTGLADTWVYHAVGALTQTSDTSYDVTQGQIDEDLGLQGANLEVSGATGSVTYTTTTSSPDVTVSPSGAISALADTGPGDYTVSGTDVDSVGNSGSWSVELQVGAAPVLITPGGDQLPGTIVGDAYSQQFSASLSPGPYTWSVTAGSLPPGLSLSSGGLLSGTPSAEGHYSFTIQAENTAEDYGASVSTSLAVAPASLVVTPSSLPGAVTGYSYTADLGLSAGAGTPTFSLASGSLPAG